MLQEMGEYELALACGLPWLQRQSGGSPHHADSVADAAACLALCYCDRAGVSLQRDNGAMTPACADLEAALALLRRFGMEEQLQLQITSALKDLAPDYCLELAALPLEPANAARRAKGVALMRGLLRDAADDGGRASLAAAHRLLQRSHDLLTAHEQLALLPEALACCCAATAAAASGGSGAAAPAAAKPPPAAAGRPLRSGGAALAAAAAAAHAAVSDSTASHHAVVGGTAGAGVPWVSEAEVLYNGALAHVVEGYLHGWPHMVHKAAQLLQQVQQLEGNDAAAPFPQQQQQLQGASSAHPNQAGGHCMGDVRLELAACAVLLGDYEGALHALGMGPAAARGGTGSAGERAADPSVDSFVRTHSPPPPAPGMAADLRPGLRLLACRWLDGVALASFRDTAAAGQQALAALESSWFTQPAVKLYCQARRLTRSDQLLGLLHLAYCALLALARQLTAALAAVAAALSHLRGSGNASQQQQTLQPASAPLAACVAPAAGGVAGRAFGGSSSSGSFRATPAPAPSSSSPSSSSIHTVRSPLGSSGMPSALQQPSMRPATSAAASSSAAPPSTLLSTSAAPSSASSSPMSSTPSLDSPYKVVGGDTTAAATPTTTSTATARRPAHAAANDGAALGRDHLERGLDAHYDGHTDDDDHHDTDDDAERAGALADGAGMELELQLAAAGGRPRGALAAGASAGRSRGPYGALTEAELRARLEQMEVAMWDSEVPGARGPASGHLARLAAAVASVPAWLAACAGVAIVGAAIITAHMRFAQQQQLMAPHVTATAAVTAASTSTTTATPAPATPSASAQQQQQLPSAREADALVRRWLEARAAALGPRHDCSKLGRVLAPGVAAEWQGMAAQLKEQGRHWEYQQHSVRVAAVRPGGAPDCAVVDVEVEETGRLIAAQRSQAQQQQAAGGSGEGGHIEDAYSSQYVSSMALRWGGKGKGWQVEALLA